MSRLISVRVDEAILRGVRRATGARSDSEAVRLALQKAHEEELEKRRMRRLLKNWAGKGSADSFKVLTDERSGRRRP